MFAGIVNFIFALIFFYSAYNGSDIIDKKFVMNCMLGIACIIVATGSWIEDKIRDYENTTRDKLNEILKEFRYELSNRILYAIRRAK